METVFFQVPSSLCTKLLRQKLFFDLVNKVVHTDVILNIYHDIIL